MRSGVRGLAALAAVVLAAGCSSPVPSPGVTTPPPSSPSVSTSPLPSPSAPPASQSEDSGAIAATSDLPCGDAIDTWNPADADYEVVLGVVGLPTPTVAAALQTSRGGVGNARLFAKRGLVIRAGSSFEMSVVGPRSLDGSIGWGSPGRPSRTLRVVDCRKGSGEWLAYPGGYETAEVGCLKLRVTSGGKSEDVSVGVGAPCPGQDPPPQPTER